MDEIPELPRAHPVLVKPELDVMGDSSKISQHSKIVILADLNVNPPETDACDSVQVVTAPDIPRLINDESHEKGSLLTSKDTDTVEAEAKKMNKLGKCRSRSSKGDAGFDFGGDADADQHGQGSVSSREEKVSSLKTGLVHVARKMPKNAHAHFILGLMYQRLGQPQKAVLAYEKAEEILFRCEVEVARPELLSLVQIHHAQCILLENFPDSNLDKELGPDELGEVLSKLKDSMHTDVRQEAIWNTLGLILLKSGRFQNAISVFSSLLAADPNNFDCLANLGIAYLQSGDLELSAKCFQDLVLKDQNHPAALVNYAVILLCKYGSVMAGAGAHAGDGASVDQFEAAHVAKECLLASLKLDPKAAHAWANLANAYYMTGDHKSSSKCLEKAAKLEPNCMSMRYAVAIHRVKDAERSQDPSEQLSWAGNEMASVLREGDSVPIEPPIAWAGLATIHKAQHEISSSFQTHQNELVETEERAFYSLKQAIGEDPDDGTHWHQLGLHCLCLRKFETAQKYLKLAVARLRESSYVWSNLGVSLQLTGEQSSQAEDVHKRALSLATTEQGHTIYSNLGNLYRQQKQYERAKAMFTKALELQPGYAPAFNNLGLVFVAEGRWEEAKFCFGKALEADPLLDSAKSNTIKATSMSKLCACLSSCKLHRSNKLQEHN
ncbi:Probable UDP-N-acetylglucosamine--peptide N-acetylglucosaminyltransferase SEC [Linum perenne]